MLKNFLEESIKKIDFNALEYKNLYNIVEADFKATLPAGEEFRECQASTVAKTIHALNSGFTRILINKPTGVGKTIISRNLFGSKEIRKSLKIEGDRPLRLLFIANRKRLLTQAERTYMKNENIEIITISTSLKDFPEDLLEQGWDITCLDEAHHESMTSFQLYLESITDVPLIGLTATPYRPDNCILKFELIISEISRTEAVEKGYLAESDIYSIMNVASKNRIDFLKRVFRDFKSQINQCIVAVRTKREVAELTEYLKKIGYTGVCGILNQNEDELNQILDDFSIGKLNILVNCNKINEGIDVKNCSVIFLGRGFDSIIQLNQTIGRAARPDSSCTIFEIIDPVQSKRNALEIVENAKSHNFVYYKGDKLIIKDLKTKQLIEERDSPRDLNVVISLKKAA